MSETIRKVRFLITRFLSFIVPKVRIFAKAIMVKQPSDLKDALQLHSPQAGSHISASAATDNSVNESTSSSLKPIFSLSVLKRNFTPPSMRDSVTVIASTRKILYIGTLQGRLIRWDPTAEVVEECRIRRVSQASTKFTGVAEDSILKIFVDPFNKDAMVFLRNHDSFYIHSQTIENPLSKKLAPLRPKSIPKLKSLRVESVSWLPPDQNGYLKIFRGNATDSSTVSSPSNPSLSGLHPKDRPLMYHAVKNSIALIGTSTGGIYAVILEKTFSSVETVYKLWQAPESNQVCRIRIESIADQYIIALGTSARLYHFAGGPSLEEVFQSADTNAKRIEWPLLDSVSDDRRKPELQFMTGQTTSTRKFVWMTSAGVMHGQIDVSRASQEAVEQKLDSPDSKLQTSIINKSKVDVGQLENNLITINITSFHIVFLYPNKLLFIHQLSGQVTQELSLLSVNRRNKSTSRNTGSLTLGLDTPATGMIRDASVDALWVYTAEGQIALINAIDEERDAWKMAAAQGRFDLAIELAGNDTATRQHLLLAQGEYLVSQNDWDAAAPLFAKTEKAVEDILLGIMEACKQDEHRCRRLCTEYLVRKLDMTIDAQPTQKTILSMLCLELYAKRLNAMPDSNLQDEFHAFLLDHHKSLNLKVARKILCMHGRFTDAATLAVISDDVFTAMEIYIAVGNIELAISMLEDTLASNSSDTSPTPPLTGTSMDLNERKLRQAANLLSRVTPLLSIFAPKKLTKIWYAFRDNPMLNLSVLISSLTRVIRGDLKTKSPEIHSEATEAAAWFLKSIILEWDSDPSFFNMTKEHKRKLVKVLLQLYTEEADEDSATELLHSLILKSPLQDNSDFKEDYDTYLFVSSRGGFRRLCVDLYGTLGLHEEAVELALTFDPELAESHASATARYELWMNIARARSDDLVGVVSRSNGVLRIENVFPLMENFESLDPSVKNYVISSLEEHKTAAEDAAKVIEKTSKDIDALRKDALMTAKEKPNLSSQKQIVFPCGHSFTRNLWDKFNEGADSNILVECLCCGSTAIESIDKYF